MDTFQNAGTLAEELDELTEQAEAIYERAESENRPLSRSDIAELKRLQGDDGGGGLIAKKAEELKQSRAIEIRQTAKLQNRLERGCYGDFGGSPKQMQTDNRGRRFAILNKADRAADYFKPVCDNQLGHFVLAKLFGASRATPEPIRAAMSESDNAVGGFLVPDRMMGEVIDLARAKSVLMDAGTRTVIMDSESLSVPKLESDVTIDNKGENTSLTISDMTFGQRVLSTYKAGAVTKISRELWEDSPQLLADQIDTWLIRKMGEQIDNWGVQGTGSQQPTGIVNASGISSTGVGGAIAWTDVSSAVTSIRNSNHEPNAVLAYPEVHDDLMTSTTGDGVNAAQNWLGAPPTLDDKLFLPSTNVPTANIVVGDFSKYLMGIRTGALVEASTEAGTAFVDHQVWVKITQRYDFVTLDDTAFHLLTGITT